MREPIKWSATTARGLARRWYPVCYYASSNMYLADHTGRHRLHESSNRCTVQCLILGRLMGTMRVPQGPPLLNRLALITVSAARKPAAHRMSRGTVGHHR